MSATRQKKLTPEAAEKVSKAKEEAAAKSGANGSDEKKSPLLLTVNTLAPERPTVIIDDVTHEFRLMQDFGPIEHQTWTQNVDRYDALWAMPKQTPAERKRMEQLLDWLFDHCLRDPKAVREQLRTTDVVDDDGLAELRAKPGLTVTVLKKRRDGSVEVEIDRLTGYIRRELVQTFTSAPWLMRARAQEEAEREDEDADLEIESHSTTES